MRHTTYDLSLASYLKKLPVNKSCSLIYSKLYITDNGQLTTIASIQHFVIYQWDKFLQEESFHLPVLYCQ